MFPTWTARCGQYGRACPQLPDNLFFEPTGKKKNYGIGTDGEFTATELFQFLYRLYKSMYELKAATA